MFCLNDLQYLFSCVGVQWFHSLDKTGFISAAQSEFTFQVNIINWAQFSADDIMNYFSNFPCKQVLEFQANYLKWRKYASNVSTCFQGKLNMINLSSAELTQSVASLTL